MVKKDTLGKAKNWKKYNNILNFLADYGTFIMILYTIFSNFFVELYNHLISSVFIILLIVDAWFIIGLVFAYLFLKSSYEERLKLNEKKNDETSIGELITIYIFANLITFGIIWALVSFIFI